MALPKTATALAFSAVGASPTAHLQVHKYPLPTLKDDQVLLEMLASPVNPQDLLVLLDKYPVKPSHSVPGDGSLVPGYDGVGRVIATGSNVSSLALGDLVIPAKHGFGTWRSHAAVAASSVVRITNTVDPGMAAILRMGVAPAYLLVEDMATLRPGDYIIHNGASSVIGQMIIQFARRRGLNTISIIRQRATQAETQQLKEDLGKLSSTASIVMTDEELADTKVFGKARIVLALDCVFGKSGAELARVASPGATFVSYGVLGQDAEHGFTLSQEMLFWKQIVFRNFRLSQSLAKRTDEQVQDLLDWFCELMQQGQLVKPQLKHVKWDSEDPNLETRLVEAVREADSSDVRHSAKKVFVFQ